MKEGYKRLQRHYERCHFFVVVLISHQASDCSIAALIPSKYILYHQRLAHDCPSYRKVRMYYTWSRTKSSTAIRDSTAGEKNEGLAWYGVQSLRRDVSQAQAQPVNSSSSFPRFHQPCGVIFQLPVEQAKRHLVLERLTLFMTVSLPLG